MAVKRVQVRHDELEAVATVPESAVRHLAEQGWRLVEESEPEQASGEPREIKPSRPATLGRPAESVQDSDDEAASTGEPKPRKNKE